MATITGNTIEITGLPAVIQITATPLAKNVISANGFVHAKDKTFRSANDGSFALELIGGDYDLIFGGASRWMVRVPDDDESYLARNLIISAITIPSTVPPATVPLATNESAGAVTVEGDDLSPTPKVPTLGQADQRYVKRFIPGRVLINGINDGWYRNRTSGKYHLVELDGATDALVWRINQESVVFAALEWAKPWATVVRAPNGDLFFRDGSADRHYLTELTSENGSLQLVTDDTPVDYSFTPNFYDVARTLLTDNANLFWCDRHTGLYHRVQYTTENGTGQLVIDETGVVEADARAVVSTSSAILTSQSNLWLKDRHTGDYVRLTQDSSSGSVQFIFSDPQNIADIV